MKENFESFKSNVSFLSKKAITCVYQLCTQLINNIPENLPLNTGYEFMSVAYASTKGMRERAKRHVRRPRPSLFHYLQRYRMATASSLPS